MRAISPGCTEMLSLDLKALPVGGPLVWNIALTIPLRDPLSSEGISLMYVRFYAAWTFFCPPLSVAFVSLVRRSARVSPPS